MLLHAATGGVHLRAAQIELAGSRRQSEDAVQLRRRLCRLRNLRGKRREPSDDLAGQAVLHVLQARPGYPLAGQSRPLCGGGPARKAPLHSVPLLAGWPGCAPGQQPQHSVALPPPPPCPCLYAMLKVAIALVEPGREVAAIVHAAAVLHNASQPGRSTSLGTTAHHPETRTPARLQGTPRWPKGQAEAYATCSTCSIMPPRHCCNAGASASNLAGAALEGEAVVGKRLLQVGRQPAALQPHEEAHLQAWVGSGNVR